MTHIVPSSCDKLNGCDHCYGTQNVKLHFDSKVEHSRARGQGITGKVGVAINGHSTKQDGQPWSQNVGLPFPRQSFTSNNQIMLLRIRNSLQQQIIGFFVELWLGNMKIRMSLKLQIVQVSVFLKFFNFFKGQFKWEVNPIKLFRSRCPNRRFHLAANHLLEDICQS